MAIVADGAAEATANEPLLLRVEARDEHDNVSAMAEGTAVLKASHGVVWADGAEGEGEEEEEEAAAAAADERQVAGARRARRRRPARPRRG